VRSSWVIGALPFRVWGQGRAVGRRRFGWLQPASSQGSATEKELNRQRNIEKPSRRLLGHPKHAPARPGMSVDLTSTAGGGLQLSDEDVISLARGAVDASREEIRRGRDGALSAELQQPGITVDLGHRNIVRLPDEVIDIIKDEIERYVLYLLPTPPKRHASHSRRSITNGYSLSSTLTFHLPSHHHHLFLFHPHPRNTICVR
jgi:hypothetical protein